MSILSFRLRSPLIGSALLAIGCGDSQASSARIAATDCAEPPLGEVRVLSSLNLSNGKIDEPSAIHADPSGGVWVLDQASKTVAHFDRNGSLLATVSASGPAPWELSAPQAVAADADGGVWISDASRARVVHFSSSGQYIEEVATPAAIGAVSLAQAGGQLLLSQRALASSSTVKGFVRRVSVARDSQPESIVDSVTSERLAAAPFYGAPIVESIVAARPGGGVVTTYTLAYRLRFFGDSGTLEREVIGCEGANTNERSLKDASLERGMNFKIFVSAMQFDSSGLLTVVLTTPQRGSHRIDVYDRNGTRLSSMRVPSRSADGVFLTGLVPGPRPRTYWALDHIDSQVRLIELAWPDSSATSAQ